MNFVKSYSLGGQCCHISTCMWLVLMFQARRLQYSRSAAVLLHFCVAVIDSARF